MTRPRSGSSPAVDRQRSSYLSTMPSPPTSAMPPPTAGQSDPGTPTVHRRRRLLLRLGIGLGAGIVFLGLLWLGLQLLLGSEALPRLINGRSDRLRVEWSSATMPLPGHLSVSGLRLRGRSRRLDWYVELERVSLRVDLRELVERHFSAAAIRGEGVRFYLRRRFASAEDRELLPFLPPIPDLEPADVGQPRAGTRPPGWRIDLQDLHLGSFEEIWIDDLRLQGHGSVAGDVSIQVRGPFAVPGLDLHWHQGELASRGEAIGRGLELASHFELEPVLTRGLGVDGLLRALVFETQLEGNVLRLSFLAPYLRHAAGLRLEGEGAMRVAGGITGGVLTPGSRIEIEARHLEARLPRISLVGSGSVSLVTRSDPARGGTVGTELRAELRGVDVEGLPGVRGTSPRITLAVSTAGADLLGGFADPEVTLDLPGLELPDLGAFADLLPAGVPVRPTGGSARLSTRLDLKRTDGEARILVTSPDLELLLGEKKARVGAALDVHYRGGLLPDSFSIAGSELELTSGTSPPATADLIVRKGTVVFGGSVDERRTDPASALRLADGELQLEGRLSDLAVLDEHFGYGRWLRLSGPVLLDAHLLSRGARLEPGSRVDMDADDLEARFLDWSVSGRARLRSRVLAAGTTELTLDFEQPQIARHGRPHIRAPGFRLEVSGPDLGGGADFESVTLRLDLPGAQVFDVTPLNDYLPAELVRIVAGEVTLDGSAMIGGHGGRTDLTLASRDLALQLLGENMRTALSLAAHLSSERPASRLFTLEGSTLSLHDTRWLGQGGENARPWSGDLELVDGSVVIGQPLSVETALRLRLQDTRPLYHVLAGQLPAVEWFERWLVFDDVTGSGRLRLVPGRISLSGLDMRGGGVHLAGGLSLETAEGEVEGMLERISEVALDAEIERPMTLELEALNRHLPASGVIRFGAGEGELSGRVHLEETSGRGSVTLVGKGLETQVRDERLDTDLRFAFDLRSDDLPSRRFRLDGSRVELTGTRWLGDERAKREPGWWGELEIVDGEVVLGSDLTADGRMKVRLRDNRPLVYLLAESSRVIRWFQRLLEIEDIEGSARIHLDRDTLRIEDLHIEGNHLLIEALLDYGGDSEYGIFYVRFRGLAAAVELVEGKRSFRVMTPRQWFDRRLAARAARPRRERP